MNRFNEALARWNRRCRPVFSVLLILALCGWGARLVTTHDHSTTAQGGAIGTQSSLTVTNTATVGGVTSSGNVLVNGGVFRATHTWGMEQLFSSGTVSAVAQFDVDLDTGVPRRYSINLRLIQNTAAGLVGLRFNQDAGAAAYTTVGNCLTSTPAADNRGSVSTDRIYLVGGGAVGIGFYFHFHGTFQNRNDSNNWVVAVGNSQYNDGTNVENCSIGGSYAGSSAVTKLRVFTSAGTITGFYQVNIIR